MSQDFDQFEEMEDNRIEREKIMNEDFMEDKLKELEEIDSFHMDEAFAKAKDEV